MLNIHNSEFALLPKSSTDSKKKTLVLDLDETLLHTSLDKLRSTNFSFFTTKKNRKQQVFVSIRPGAQEFLKEMAQHYELVIFTASQKEYCDFLVDFLDPENQYIKHRLYRHHCVVYQDAFVKDLRRLGRHLKNIIIIDNNPDSYLFTQENGCDIPSFIDDLEDRELDNLIPFLL